MNTATDPSWHSRKIAEMAKLGADSLQFIIDDCHLAAKAAQALGNVEAEGRYLDEGHYAAMALRKLRARK